MLIDVLVLVMLVDGHPHRADLGQHHITHSAGHHQVDAGARIGAQQQFVQFGGHPLGSDAGKLLGHLVDGGAHPRRHGEAELGDEPGGAQHPQRVVSEGVLRCHRGVQHLVS